MERGGDAVGEQLRLGITDRDLGGELDPGPRLHLPLERVAVQVDDPRQHEQAARVQRRAAAGAIADRSTRPARP